MSFIQPDSFVHASGQALVIATVLALASATHGEVIWWFDFAGSTPVDVPAAKLEQITAAMDSAVEYYNAYADYNVNTYSFDPRGIRVIYNENVPTANAAYRSRIAFGGKINDWTAMHEMAHVFGVGTIGAWNANRNQQANLWAGPLAIAELQAIDGTGAVLHADSIHFWPYGLNVADGDRHAHVRMVGALREDMGLSNGTYRFDDSDFNRDGSQDAFDLQLFKQNWLATNDGIGDVSYRLGDRNMDGVNDLADWALIRQDFAAAGSLSTFENFAAHAAVPEPTCLLLSVFGVGAFVATRMRVAK